MDNRVFTGCHQQQHRLLQLLRFQSHIQEGVRCHSHSLHLPIHPSTDYGAAEDKSHVYGGRGLDGAVVLPDCRNLEHHIHDSQQDHEPGQLGAGRAPVHGLPGCVLWCQGLGLLIADMECVGYP